MILNKKADLIQNHDFTKKIVLVRADLNLPLVDNVITDKTRLFKLIPTIKYLQNYNTKIVIISHFKQPRMRDERFSLKFLIGDLTKILNTKVNFIDDCIGNEVHTIIKNLPEQSIVLLENLRFYKGEEDNSVDFAKKLAVTADVYVNDAFSCCHRNHASIVKIPELLPSFIGLNLQEELKHLNNVIHTTSKPTALIIGGSKISTKIGILQNMIKKIDFLILGGAIANNFLLAKKIKIGSSLYEKSMMQMVRDIINNANHYQCKIILPIDCIAAKSVNDKLAKVKDLNDIENDDIIFDIGPKTIQEITKVLVACKLIFWNGPLGAFEYQDFSKGTLNIAKNLSYFTKSHNLKSIVGGGDSISAISSANLSEQDFTYVSTGGGALLQFLSEKKLPGLQALGL